MKQEGQNADKNPSSDESHKKLLIGLAILILLMFAMITAIILRLNSK